MLPSSEIAAMQAVQELAMPESAQIQQKTATNTATGISEVWEAHGEPVSCRIGALGGTPQEKVIADRLGDHVGYVLTLPAGTVITIANRLIISGRTFEVVGFIEKSYQTTLRAVCIEVK